MNKNGDWLSWAIGMVGGVLLWNAFKSSLVTGATPAAAVPPAAPKYPDLGSVARRIDAVWKSFKAGKMTTAAALAEAKELQDAANSFSLERGEDATVIYAQALALEDSIKQETERTTF